MNELQVFLVGGAVRDELLGLPVTERDWVVVGATVEDMRRKKFQQVGKDFPVFLHPETKEEYALARMERKSGKGYYGFVCDFAKTVTLEDDLQRRDLTINAIAQDNDGNIVDPFGGQQDLQNKVLRHVSDAFVEDPLRVLRVARFAARLYKLGFKVAAETMELMRQIVASQEILHLSVERIWLELVKSLQTDNPEQFILVMRECGALQQIFPELAALWGIPQNAKWHPEIDTGEHIVLAIKQITSLSSDPKVRFAVLCHDLGKGITPQEILPSHRGHEVAGVALVEKWCRKYKVPRDYLELAVKVTRWHLHCHMAFELTAKTILNLFISLDAFRKPQNLDNFLLACTADARGRQGRQNEPYSQVALLQAAYGAAKTVTAEPFLQDGLQGVKLGNAIRAARIKQIKQVKKSF